MLEDCEESRRVGAPSLCRDTDQEVGEVTVHAKWLSLLERLSMANWKLVDPAPVEERLVAEGHNHQDADAIETGKDAEVGSPLEF